MAGASQEYVVRAPNENSKRFNVMRFANSLNVDVTKWKVARMERERSLKQQEKAATEETPKFGFGSEYGKDAKEEARRKKYGQYYRKNRDNDFPWVLRVGGKNGKKFKGTREGGVTENTSYYVFFQAHDGAFEAFPVSEWYNFTAIPRYKPLTSEEAEERYEERHKIYNHFAVMASRKHTEGGESEQSETKLLKNMKKEKDFKVSDMDDWVDSDRSGDGSDDDELDGGNQKNGKGKGKGKAKGAGKKKGGKKKKGSDDDDDDSEPGEESDEGDQEAREVDYMSDLSSSSEEEDLEEKLNKELKGVEDEDALRKLVLSDDDEDEEEEGKDKEDAKGAAKGDGDEVSKGNEPAGKVKVKQENKSSDSGTSASDDSDDSDLDDSKFQSAMFLQKKSGSATKNKNGSDQKASSSKSNTPVTDQAGQSNNDNGDADSKSALKRKLPSAENSPSVKKPKTNDSGSGGEAISEDAVRRYLMRKPMTAAELLQKFKGRKVPLKGQDLVTTIAAILKKLNPDKQTIKGKLHLYIKPPTGP